MTPYATSNHNNPNITEIVFENDLEEILDQASAAQLKASPNAWAALETFQNVFRVFLLINFHNTYIKFFNEENKFNLNYHFEFNR